MFKIKYTILYGKFPKFLIQVSFAVSFISKIFSAFCAGDVQKAYA
jgi:hypothetical protein